MVANISLKVVFGMFFLVLNSANVDFLKQKFQWKTYITRKTLSTTTYIKLVEKKELAAIILDPKYETFIVHIVSLTSSVPFTNLNINPFCRSQIVGLIAKKSLTKVSIEYANFINVFSSDSAFKFFKHIEINNHTIEIVNGQ